MTGSSVDWLSLREPADQRSRNRSLAAQLAAQFSLRNSISVVDLAAGIGANLRASADLLPQRQNWHLTDPDPDNLAAARKALSRWADSASVSDKELALNKAGKAFSITFEVADPLTNLDTLLSAPFDLVTASAFFERASAQFIRRLVKLTANARAVFYGLLTYNGQQSWQPRHPLDNQLRAAYHAYQIADKGLGVATGPTAPAELADAYTMAGYSVSDGASDWRLTADDQCLITSYAERFAAAVHDTNTIEAPDIARWSSIARTAAIVGQTDTLAIPPIDSMTPEDGNPVRAGPN